MKRSTEALIEGVVLRPSRVQPIIVNFQNGELKDEEANKMKCGLFHDEKTNRRLLAMSNGRAVYRGYKPDVDKDLTRTMLAIHNRRTGKVRLVQAENWPVAPILDKVLESDKDTQEDKIALLNKQFGSKRVKRRTEQIERMKINADSAREQLERTVSKVQIERADLTLPSVNDESVANTNLPECNRDASEVEDVYNLEDIVSRNKLRTMYDTARSVLKDGLEDKPSYIIKTLEAIRSESDSLEKVAILLYMDMVAAWLSMLIKDAKKRGVEICHYSNLINNHIIESYSMPSANGRSRPNSMKDKALMHCLILGLMVSNYTLDLQLFATLFKNRIGMKKLSDLARFVGAVPIKDNKNIVVLKLPLPSQLVVARKGKKK